MNRPTKERLDDLRKLPVRLYNAVHFGEKLEIPNDEEIYNALVALLAEINALKAEKSNSAYEWQKQALQARRERDTLRAENVSIIKSTKINLENYDEAFKQLKEENTRLKERVLNLRSTINWCIGAVLGLGGSSTYLTQVLAQDSELHSEGTQIQSTSEYKLRALTVDPENLKDLPTEDDDEQRSQSSESSSSGSFNPKNEEKEQIIPEREGSNPPDETI